MLFRSTNSVCNALAKIKGIECALNNCRRALEARGSIENVLSKENKESNGSDAT